VPLERIRWPDDLGWILARLKPGTDQLILETPMDAGSPKRRPLHTALSTLEGVVELDEATWQLLSRLKTSADRQIVVLPMPDGDRMSAFKETWVQKAVTSNGLTRRVVRIVMIDHGPAK